MSEIIQKWLSSRLGIILDLNLLSFGDIAKDGHLIAQILCSYGIINTDDLDRICKTDNSDYALQNLLFLNPFLKTIGIDYAKKKLEAIAHGDGMTALRLFYQLYLILNNKNKLYFATTQVTKEKSEIKIKSDLIQSETAATEKSKEIQNPDLDSTAAVYKWHKNNYLEQFFKCKEIREKYLKQFEDDIKNRHISIKESNETEKGVKTHTTNKIVGVYESDSDINVAFQNKIKQFSVPNIKCEINMSQANEYVSTLKKKTKKFIEEKKLQQFMHKLFMNNLLETLLENQRVEFHDTISKKLLKQSYYEKQMETKLLEIRRQKDTIIKNKNLENEFLMKKKDEKFIAELYQQRHNIALANLRNDNERKRILELHKKLYKQKCERKFKKHWAMCTGIVNDVFKLTMKTLEYKDNYEVEVPASLWKDWITLFCAEQELIEPMENVEDLLEEEENQDIFSLEIYRQNQLDERDMSDYLCSEWPWNLDEIQDLYTNCYIYIKLGENVLGHIVHKILEAKYPFPPLPQIPLLPKVLNAGSVVGSTDENLIGVLETILKRKQILIINMQSAINYCINAFIKENPKEIEQKPPAVKNEKGSKGKERKKREKTPKKGEKSSVKRKGDVNPSKEPQERETQTPKLFPGEEFQFSPQAKLGEIANETMSLGLPLNERLIANMFVEYLKSLKDLKGWVLMNYPENITAAITLEYALTGQEIPYENEDNESLDEEYTLLDYMRDELFVEPDDEFEEKRVSKLLPNPPIYGEVKHKSYLNSFIYLMQKTEQINPEIEHADFVQDFTALKNFYDKLGCNNSVNYLSLDPDTIKEIILMITKDNVFANEMYDDIMQIVAEIIEKNKKRREEEAEIKRKALEAAGKKGKKNKSKKSDKGDKKSDKGDKKSKKGKESPRQPQVEEIPVPPPEPEIVEPPPKPGEPKWMYVNLPQPLETKIILASFWEDVEEIYLNDFKQLFYLKRLAQNAIVPYVHKIFTHMIKYIERPDAKQEYLYKFQLTYNELENDLREDDEFKIEMHCRIAEFKSKLWDICVSKMRDSEAERIRIINEIWFYEQTATFISIFNSIMQLEMDRCASTYFFLQDYYYAMTPPPGLIENKFTKFTVKQFPVNENESQFLINAFTDTSFSIENNPFVDFLNSVLQETINATSSWYSLAMSNCKKIEAVIAVKEKKSKKDKKKGLSDKVTPLTEQEKALESLLQEWQCAIEGENLRIKYRLTLLNAKAKYDIYELLLSGENLFHDLYAKLDQRYHAELHSVNTVCDIFTKAVEACESIQPRLILEGSGFYVGSNQLLYEDPLEVPHLYKEEITNLHFTTAQLSKLADIFFNIAPRDSIPTKAFTYILEDMVVHILENNEDSLLPYHWHLLQPEKVRELVGNMFGKVEYISWKDFIIYNLEIEFPTEFELLNTRHQFREMDPDRLEFVNEVQFNMVQFWFETEEHMYRNPIRKDLIKKLLAKLFKISGDRINYSALLLSFCKDKDPIIGVAKAFGLSMAKLICWNKEVGNHYIEILSYQKYLKEQERLEALEAAEDICSDILRSVVPVSDGSERTFHSKKSYDQSIYGEGSFIFDEMLPEEVVDLYIPELCYILPFNVVLIILTNAIPWHYRVQCIEDNSLRETLEIIYESCRNDEHDCVFAHEFLNSTVFKNFLNQNSKFVAMSPAEYVQAEIEICKCTKDHVSVSIN